MCTNLGSIALEHWTHPASRNIPKTLDSWCELVKCCPLQAEVVPKDLSARGGDKTWLAHRLTHHSALSPLAGYNLQSHTQRACL